MRAPGNEVDHFRLTFRASVSNRLFVRNKSYKNAFCLQVHLHANQSFLCERCERHRDFKFPRNYAVKKWGCSQPITFEISFVTQLVTFQCNLHNRRSSLKFLTAKPIKSADYRGLFKGFLPVNAKRQQAIKVGVFYLKGNVIL